jgi:hypothetical protein
MEKPEVRNPKSEVFGARRARISLRVPITMQTAEFVHFWEDLRARFHQSHYSYYSHWLRLRRATGLWFRISDFELRI